jgi:hypothetical protein
MRQAFHFMEVDGFLSVALVLFSGLNVIIASSSWFV